MLRRRGKINEVRVVCVYVCSHQFTLEIPFRHHIRDIGWAVTYESSFVERI